MNTVNNELKVSQGQKQVLAELNKPNTYLVCCGKLAPETDYKTHIMSPTNTDMAISSVHHKTVVVLLNNGWVERIPTTSIFCDDLRRCYNNIHNDAKQYIDEHDFEGAITACKIAATLHRAILLGKYYTISAAGIEALGLQS